MEENRAKRSAAIEARDAAYARHNAGKARSHWEADPGAKRKVPHFH